MCVCVCGFRCDMVSAYMCEVDGASESWGRIYAFGVVAQNIFGWMDKQGGETGGLWVMGGCGPRVVVKYCWHVRKRDCKACLNYWIHFVLYVVWGGATFGVWCMIAEARWVCVCVFPGGRERKGVWWTSFRWLTEITICGGKIWIFVRKNCLDFFEF